MKKATRPTKKKSVRQKNLGRYKSALEKYCADRLKDANIPFYYEEKSYRLQDSFRYEAVYWKMTASKKDMTDMSNKVVLPISYTPDFSGVDRNWIIETKGYSRQQHTFPIRWKMFLRHLNEAGQPCPALFMPKNKQQIDHTIEIIKKLVENGEI